ncbi:SF1B family DNA helicase RecD2 [Sulfuriroseicoccus oceanibius]|uniref:ATP-dependent RecD-like DNA helicase n=1 Tax=Sulfuriroseicoccus oceanibius TaxID=2707525 RepID=A0A6B3LC12_9BACT|nr:ATP-dependent RecD-like DNA helicase [Sulfuriroseicoccus oceanibius]QQL45854.1 ATP-dependent RecD-like DNA helicase [Sulfuriroseicoccus oceanibius]
MSNGNEFLQGVAAVRGEVVRVSFHNEENGFSVLRVVLDGGGGQVTVTGRCPMPRAGERMEADGDWRDDPQFGRQFSARRIELQEPESLEGMASFLGSGLVDGVGPKLAQRIVDKFGKDVMTVLNRESKRLEEVEGVGEKRRREIKAGWDAARELRQVMIYLFSQGISSARAMKIFQRYGAETRKVLQTNPYKLVDDIAGIGFKTADEMAAKIGVERDSLLRVGAGLKHVVSDGATHGHAAVPVPMLVEKTCELIGVGEQEVEVALARVCGAGELEQHEVDGQMMVYQPELRRAEEHIAEVIRELVRDGDGVRINEEKAMAWVRHHKEFDLSDGQMEAVRLAVSSPVCVITGGPGVGKTTVLRSLLGVMDVEGLECKLAAPTGRAAQRLAESSGMEAQTLHRMLGYRPSGGFNFHQGRKLEGDVFVVDEVSMVDLPLMRAFLDAVPDGASVILVGDADQLPSVGPGAVLGDLIESGAVPVARLTEVFRQGEGSRIITVSHEVNHGRMPDLQPEKGSDCFFLERSSPLATRETLLHLVAERLPAGLEVDPIADVQVLTPMHKGALGTVELNRELQARLNPPSEFKPEIERYGMTFRRGDKVIQIRNSYDRGVFNGDLGRVAEIELESHSVTVRFDAGEIATYTPNELDELRLAYAITIHKSQGSEFPVVVMPLSNQHFVLLERNLIYTGLTRGRRQVVMLGERKALEMGISRHQAHQRFGGLRALLAAEI